MKKVIGAGREAGTSGIFIWFYKTLLASSMQACLWRGWGYGDFIPGPVGKKSRKKHDSRHRRGNRIAFIIPDF